MHKHAHGLVPASDSCAYTVTPHTVQRILGPMSGVTMPSYKPWLDEHDGWFHALRECACVCALCACDLSVMPRFQLTSQGSTSTMVVSISSCGVGKSARVICSFILFCVCVCVFCLAVPLPLCQNTNRHVNESARLLECHVNESARLLECSNLASACVFMGVCMCICTLYQLPRLLIDDVSMHVCAQVHKYVATLHEKHDEHLKLSGSLIQNSIFDTYKLVFPWASLL
jgi:hypothetical protein